MSARARGTLALCVSLGVFGASHALGGGNPDASEPTSRPATESVGSFGAVQEALQLLYVMPNPSARSREMMPKAPTPAPAPRPVERSQANPSVQANTRAPMSEEDRAALEHAGLLPPVEADAAAGGPPAPYVYPTYGPRVPQHRRDFSNYRYFGGRPGLYGYGAHNAYAPDDTAGDWYRFGFMRGADYHRFYNESNARTDAVLQHFKGHLSKALTLFNQGRYREAADAFRLAANSNHGDPASRIYTAHALFAIGRYQEAIPYLRRAYELQPQITFLNFDIRDDYGNRADFEEQLRALEHAVSLSPGNIDRLLMLGYIRYYTNQRDLAYDVLSRAYQLNRGDPLVGRLLENSRPSDVLLDSMKSGGR